MTINKGLLSSKSDEWTTPRWLFDRLNNVFDFTLDAAATIDNSLCIICCTAELSDGLKASWKDERVWLNCPYSQIAKWMAKCTEEAGKADLIVALVPARTDTRWWHEHVVKVDLVHFIKGRLRFGESKTSAPFPSALVFWFGLRDLCDLAHRR